MMRSARVLLASLVFAACSLRALGVLALDDLSLVCTAKPEIVEPEALRAAVEAELHVPTRLRDRPSGATVFVEADDIHAVRLRFEQAGKPSVQRTLDISAQQAHATSVIALLAANMVRDEASELLAQLEPAVSEPAAPAAPAAQEAPPSRPARPWSPSGCRRNALREVRVGADLFPFVGTSLRDGTSVERRLSFNLIGGLTGSLRGIELGGVFNLETETMCGVQFAGTLNFVRSDAAGVQIGTLNIVGGGFRGVQLATTNFAGADVRGVQLGTVNIAMGRMRGPQLGMSNLVVDDFSGVQAGMLNLALGRVSGVQLGLLNIATRRVSGALIGLVNVAKDADAAVGLVNVLWNGRTQLDAWGTDAGLMMVGLTHGARVTHSVYGVGFRPIAGGLAFSGALGFGARVHSSRLTVDIDAVAFSLVGKDDASSGLETAVISQLRVPVSFTIVPGVAVFAAPSVSVSVTQSEALALRDLALFGATRLTDAGAASEVRIWPGLSLGVRLL